MRVESHNPTDEFTYSSRRKKTVRRVSSTCERPAYCAGEEANPERELTEAAANHEHHEVHPTSDNNLNRVNDQGDSKDSDKDASVTQ